MTQVVRFETVEDYDLGSGPSKVHIVGSGKLDGAGLDEGGVWCWSADFDFVRVIPLSCCVHVDVIPGMVAIIPGG